MKQYYFKYFSLRNRNGTSKSEANPFEEEEWDEGDGESVLVDNGEPGVPVKALYDYEGAESDELTFKQGMEILCILQKVKFELMDFNEKNFNRLVDIVVVEK